MSLQDPAGLCTGWVSLGDRHCGKVLDSRFQASDMKKPRAAARLTEALVMTVTRLPLRTDRAAAAWPGGLPSKISDPIVTSCAFRKMLA